MSLIKFLIDLLLPPRCCNCEEITSNHAICKTCQDNLIHDKKIQFLKNNKYIDCHMWNYRLEPILSSFFLDIKNHLTYRYFETLPLLLDFSLNQKTLIDSVDCIVFVPTSKKILKQRGFNLAQVIGEILSEQYKKPLFSLLNKSRETKQQKNISKNERRQNLKNAFVINNDFNVNLSNKKILLVDDIQTTGATLLECSKIIGKSYQNIRIYTLVIAKT